MLDFPNSPTVGQVFGQWLWDGGKWGPTAGGGAAPINSPSFTGDPKAPTPATADHDTSIATTAFVKAQGYLLNNQVITLSGDLSGSGATAITTTLATVPVTKGGTGLTGGTSGGIPYYSGAAAITSSAALAAGQVVTGGGAGAAPATIANGQLPATATNDSAAAGKLGEYINSKVPHSSGTALTTTVNKNVTSISLTAGDWDVGGSVFFECNAFASNQFVAGVSLNSAGFPDQSVTAQILANAGVYASTGLLVPQVRIILTATTTVYLVAMCSFSSGTVAASGMLWARRPR